MAQKYTHGTKSGFYYILKHAKASGNLKKIDPDMIVYHDLNGQCYVRPKEEFFRVMVPVK